MLPPPATSRSSPNLLVQDRTPLLLPHQVQVGMEEKPGGKLAARGRGRGHRERLCLWPGHRGATTTSSSVPLPPPCTAARAGRDGAEGTGEKRHNWIGGERTCGDWRLVA